MIDLPGFADPAGDAQACFRAVLDAMARPGRIHAAGAGLAAPGGLYPATAAVLLTLADADTSVFIDPQDAAAREWVAFHCGCGFAEAGRASLVVAGAWRDLGELDGGTDEAPHASATLLLQVAALGAGPGHMLAGPGLREPAILRVTGLRADFAAAWAANHALFPRGVDLVLCAPDAIAALPRSVAVTPVREG